MSDRPNPNHHHSNWPMLLLARAAESFTGFGTGWRDRVWNGKCCWLFRGTVSLSAGPEGIWNAEGNRDMRRQAEQ
ncbi:uncharacterized protein N7496_009678 [Penicillium cataractarum]|uniref:Uncharacterized protein n=1 Tax=Penicillium cataractarum TaxID=2100454 RepID=A0A9W9RPD9_9EURO|nr:uncharacterized protein N7496_009678 [Penicillium cataractarum]KAJ5363965.1 hypothetical protein N7496_009678 [Penicillium cataractarum]